MSITTSRRRALQLAGATFLLPFVAGRPASVFAQATVEPVKGGELTFVVNPEPTALVSAGTTASSVRMLSAKVVEGLFSYDFDLNPVPQLATEWSKSDDGLEYTFKLRQGVKWHDGRDFTSADVAYSISVVREVHPNGRGLYANVTEVKTPDAHTAVIVLSKPNLALITALAANETPILPKHLYDGKPYADNPVNNAPIGTGPYIFKEWVRGSYIIYDRNPNYWDAPRPYVDRLIVKIIPDALATVVGFENGEIDIGFNNPVPLSDIDRLKFLPHIGVETKGYTYNAGLTMLIFNLERPLFKDLKVRQAFAHAIDRQAILDIAWYGHGKIATGPVSPLLTRYAATDLPQYEFDPKKAEALLDEAGYPRDADGIRLKLTHDFLPYGPVFPRVADYIKQALAAVGIEVTIRAQDFATYTKRVYTDRDFDFVNAWFSTGYDPSALQRFFWSKNFKKGLPFSNTAGYVSEEMDRLLISAAEEPDLDKRVALYKEIQHLIVKDLPEFDLVVQDIFTVFNKRVHDHTVGAEGIMGNLSGVFIKA